MFCRVPYRGLLCERVLFRVLRARFLRCRSCVGRVWDRPGMHFGRVLTRVLARSLSRIGLRACFRLATCSCAFFALPALNCACVRLCFQGFRSPFQACFAALLIVNCTASVFRFHAFRFCSDACFAAFLIANCAASASAFREFCVRIFCVAYRELRVFLVMFPCISAVF